VGNGESYLVISFTFKKMTMNCETNNPMVFGKGNPNATGYLRKKNCGEFKTRYFELVELIIGLNFAVQGAKVAFVDQAQLRSQPDQRITIIALETFSNQVVPLTPTGNPVATPAQIKNAFLTLNVYSYDFLNKMPLAMINRIFGDTTLAANFVPYQERIFQLDDVERIDFTKSSVTFASTAAAAQFSYLFGFHYLMSPDKQGG
jgi:hypothetical protein